ncbi:hypothetical protein D1872_206580 [compost metagenome]
MEELLNKVHDNEIKDYLNEALKCYTGGSFRACVIMSVIAGGYDLHKKVKALAGSDSSFRKLDEEVEKKKNNNEVYEKYLFEQCATKEIDMLNNSELKELQRCLDTRNDCAHPSNFICSPEKARDIYSSIIDILASKPVLFGFKHMKNLIDELKEKTFFPVINTEKMNLMVSANLNKFQDKAKSSLFKLLVTTIKTTTLPIQKINAIRFLAFSAEYATNEFEGIIKELIDKDQYQGEFLEIISLNTDTLSVLSEMSIEKLMYKLEDNLNANEINNLDKWIKVIFSERLQSENHIKSVAQLVTRYRARNFFMDISLKIDIRFEVVKSLLINENCSENFKDLLREHSHKDFNLYHYLDNTMIDVLILLKDKNLYDHWLKKVIKNIHSYDFKVANTAVSVFKSIPKEHWYDMINDDLKINLVKNIIYEGAKDSQYYSHDCRSLMYSLPSDYPELTKLFLDHLFANLSNERIRPFFGGKYLEVVSRYIVNCNGVVESYLEKLNYLEDDLLDIKQIITQLKADIEEIQDDESKSTLLNNSIFTVIRD